MAHGHTSQIARRSFTEDPYSAYAEWREQEPVRYDEHLQGWLLTRYEDVRDALNDRRLSAARPLDVRDWLGTHEKFLEVRNSMLMFMDQPRHTELKRALVVAMRFDLDEITALVAARCEELLDRVADRSEVDLIADLALPLPIEVLGARLGIPPEDVPQISDWADVFNLALGRSVTPSVVSRAEAAALEFEGYVSGLLRDGRLNPGILYDLHQGVEQSRFGLNEMLATSLMLVSAGMSTVTDLIGSAALGLARDQQTENQARKDGNGVSEMLDEVLRLFSPVQMTRRVALTPLSIGGQSIKAGERVIPVLAAANRDPMIFPAPLETDDRRDAAKRHLAFGAGRHRCPGANLAQVEAAVAIRSILERFAPLELREEPTWKHNPTFRGLSRLVVSNPRRGSRTVD